MAEQVALYQRVKSPGENIPLAVAPFSINGSIPDEEEIKWEVSHMKYNRSGVPSGQV